MRPLNRLGRFRSLPSPRPRLAARPRRSVGPGPDAREPPGLANRVRVRFDVGEESRMVLLLQSLLDESAQDDLEAHGELELHRRLAGEDARPAQDVLGQNEEHSGAVLQ